MDSAVAEVKPSIFCHYCVMRDIMVKAGMNEKNIEDYAKSRRGKAFMKQLLNHTQCVVL